MAGRGFLPYGLSGIDLVRVLSVGVVGNGQEVLVNDTPAGR